MDESIIKVSHEHLEVYAMEMLKEYKYTTSDQYGFWNVTCYPEDELVEFQLGGAGLVPNSAFLE